MKTKHKKTLDIIFSDPVNGSIEWKKIEALLIALGCQVIEGSGLSASHLKNRVLGLISIGRTQIKNLLGIELKTLVSFLRK
jgi:hypothetical protein